ERDRTLGPAASERTKHGPVVLRLRRRYGGIRIAHDRGRDRAALEHHIGLHTEERGIPDTQISHLSHLNRADIGGDTLRNRRIDRVLREVTASSEVVVLTRLLRQAPELFFHLICGLPGTDDHFADSTHRLTVR